MLHDFVNDQILRGRENQGDCASDGLYDVKGKTCSQHIAPAADQYAAYAGCLQVRGSSHCYFVHRVRIHCVLAGWFDCCARSSNFNSSKSSHQVTLKIVESTILVK